MSAASLSGAQAASPAATSIKRKANSVLEGDDDDLCGLAKRIPKARKEGPDEVENRRKDLIRRCLIKSVDFFCKHEEEYAQTVWNMLEANMISTKTAGTSAHMFPHALKSIDKVPKIWNV